MTTEDYKKLAPTLPHQPGVYRYLDDKGVVLYVGKAKNLKKRIASYFGNKKHQAHRTRVLIRVASSLVYTIVESEQDALLLENSLIKNLQPRYNVQLKDGKTYPYICIKKERFPRVFMTRNVVRDGSKYYGPYPSVKRISIVLEIIRRLFRLRTCSYNLSEANIEKGKFKVCLEFHIKNCNGPCEGLEDEEAYNEKISQIKNILKGNFSQVRQYLKTHMALSVEQLEFEKAQVFKEKLHLLENYRSKSTVVSPTIVDADVFTIEIIENLAIVNYMKIGNGALLNTFMLEMVPNLNDKPEALLEYSVPILMEKFNSIAAELIVPFPIQLPEMEGITITVPQRGEKKKLLDLSSKNLTYYKLLKQKENLNKEQKQTHAARILKTMEKDLQLDGIPTHIECFDNSNLMGTHPVASMVVFKNVRPAKKDYRHYHIKTVVGPDDYASMEEVVYRRYKRLLEEDKQLPQLIVIDGGKGQLSSAMKSIRELGLEKRITVIGIAKRLEEIYFADDPIPLHLSKRSETLKVIQQLRNEAHRFAITFHRNLRSKDFAKTELTDVPGIGKKTAQKLLLHFKSVDRIKQATTGELRRVAGKAVAEKLLAYFNGKDKGE